ncbi:hypothetical protein [Microbacterium sp. KNMS]
MLSIVIWLALALPALQRLDQVVGVIELRPSEYVTSVVLTIVPPLASFSLMLHPRIATKTRGVVWFLTLLSLVVAYWAATSVWGLPPAQGFLLFSYVFLFFKWCAGMLEIGAEPQA